IKGPDRRLVVHQERVEFRDPNHRGAGVSPAPVVTTASVRVTGPRTLTLASEPVAPRRLAIRLAVAVGMLPARVSPLTPPATT
ncbi:MAG: hypothetical protein JNK70_09945, partial [Phycisphaerae bacterium]|nr:hypothetical protein [Phycisphaerae bacterium]